MVTSQIVTYTLDDGSAVLFEIDSIEGFTPAGIHDVAGVVRKAVGPAVAAARVVLDGVREASPSDVQMKFGIKVSGKANWIVARAATEGNFEVTLSWHPGADPSENRSVDAAGPALPG